MFAKNKNLKPHHFAFKIHKLFQRRKLEINDINPYLLFLPHVAETEKESKNVAKLKNKKLPGELLI